MWCKIVSTCCSGRRQCHRAVEAQHSGEDDSTIGEFGDLRIPECVGDLFASLVVEESRARHREDCGGGTTWHMLLRLIERRWKYYILIRGQPSSAMIK